MKRKKSNVIKSISTKFKKLQKGHLQVTEWKRTATTLYYGVYGLKVLKPCRINSKQLEAARRLISRSLRKHEFLWIRVVPDIPITSKPNEVRMGKGKGSVDYWAARLKSGQTIFELTCMLSKKAYVILMSAAKKLPVPCAFIFSQKKNSFSK
jgi:large subunit ribosomal protein L16